MKNGRIIFKKIFLIIFFVSINILAVNALQMQVHINETSSLTKLLSGQYSLKATGTLEFHNPSNFSKVYEFNVPLSFDSLVGIEKISVDNTSSRFEFTHDKIHGYFIEPNETIRVKYKIFGLLNYNLYNMINPKNISVFQYYSKPMEFSSNIRIFLQKAQREGFTYNLNRTLVSSPAANTTSRRLVSAGIENPTDFSYTSKEIKLYKTNVSDPFFNNGQLVKVVKNQTIGPESKELVDLLDYNSSAYSVYWVSSNFIMDYNLTSTHKEKFSIQQPISSSSGGNMGGGGFFNLSNSSLNSLYESVLLKKSVNQTVVKRGDTFKVYLRIVNVNSVPISNLVVKDLVPTGYEIKDASSSVKISNGSLTFNVNKVGAFQTFVISYSLKNKNDLTGITYLKPAELDFLNNTIYSQGVLLINELLPQKKIFVQKNVQYVDSSYARVIITVQNLGSIAVNNLLISDNIDPNSTLKDISQVFFKRGSWIIKSLSPGGNWQVSYLIQRNNNTDLETLPNVYGVEKNSVYGNLISSGEVVTVFKQPPKGIEKVGMGFAVGLLVFYLLF